MLWGDRGRRKGSEPVSPCGRSGTGGARGGSSRRPPRCCTPCDAASGPFSRCHDRPLIVRICDRAHSSPAASASDSCGSPLRLRNEAVCSDGVCRRGSACRRGAPRSRTTPGTARSPSDRLARSGSRASDHHADDTRLCAAMDAARALALRALSDAFCRSHTRCAGTLRHRRRGGARGPHAPTRR